jgi:hypothetical protein
MDARCQSDQMSYTRNRKNYHAQHERAHTSINAMLAGNHGSSHKPVRVNRDVRRLLGRNLEKAESCRRLYRFFIAV